MEKLHVVLAEDDKILSKVVVAELEEAGFEVTDVVNGAEAIEAVRKKKPDLVLMDIVMPEKNGFEALEELQKSSDTRDVPVIIMTMLGSDDDIKKGLSLGAKDYIVKSQHAVGEIIDKVKEFFHAGDDTPVSDSEENEAGE